MNTRFDSPGCRTIRLSGAEPQAGALATLRHGYALDAWLQFAQQPLTPRTRLGQVPLKIGRTPDEHDVPKLSVNWFRKVTLQVPHTEVPSHWAVAHPQQDHKRLQRIPPEGRKSLYLSTANYCLSNETLADSEPLP